MKNISVVFLIITCLLFQFSCKTVKNSNTLKFYDEIYKTRDNMIKLINKDKRDKGEKQKYKYNNFTVDSLLFRSLEKEFKNSKHIIYLCDASSSYFGGTFYDIENNIYYILEINLKTKSVNYLEHRNNLDLDIYEFEKFVFENYLNNNCHILKEKGNVRLSGGRHYIFILDINLKDNQNKGCYFQNFIYDKNPIIRPPATANVTFVPISTGK